MAVLPAGAWRLGSGAGRREQLSWSRSVYAGLEHRHAAKDGPSPSHSPSPDHRLAVRAPCPTICAERCGDGPLCQGHHRSPQLWGDGPGAWPCWLVWRGAARLERSSGCHLQGPALRFALPCACCACWPGPWPVLAATRPLTKPDAPPQPWPPAPAMRSGPALRHPRRAGAHGHLAADGRHAAAARQRVRLGGRPPAQPAAGGPGGV